MQSGPQQKSGEARHRSQPPQTIMLLVVCRLLPPNHLIPAEKLCLFFCDSLSNTSGSMYQESITRRFFLAFLLLSGGFNGMSKWLYPLINVEIDFFYCPRSFSSSSCLPLQSK
jgi:hypothetical protein